MQKEFKLSLSIVFFLLLLALVPNLTLALLISCHYYLKFIELSFVIAENPKDIRAFYNRGTFRSEWGDRQGAIYDFTQAIKVRSSNPQTVVRAASAYFQRGQEYELLGDRQKALSDYQKAAEIYKQHGEIDSYKRVLHEIRLVGVMD